VTKVCDALDYWNFGDSHDNRLSGRVSNSGPYECETGNLIAIPGLFTIVRLTVGLLYVCYELPEYTLSDQ
jgi:hypothetical protein